MSLSRFSLGKFLSMFVVMATLVAAGPLQAAVRDGRQSQTSRHVEVVRVAGYLGFARCVANHFREIIGTGDGWAYIGMYTTPGLLLTDAVCIPAI